MTQSNTAAIMDSMNFLPSFASPIEKAAKESRQLVNTEAKYWRYTGTELMIQPTGGDKFKGGKKTTIKQLNFEILYVGFLDAKGNSNGGFSLRAEKLFSLSQSNVIPSLQAHLELYLNNLKEVEAKM